MTTFVVDSENNILAYGSGEEAKAADSTAAVEIFSTQKELASLAEKWPTGRLVEVWNAFAGVVPFDELKPVKKFTDRKTAVARIWTVIQRLEASVAPQAAHVAPKAAASAQEATAKKKAAKPPKSASAREGSKKAVVLDLLQRPQGASLEEIVRATQWLPHSVRGFLSGALRAKMGLVVESTKTAQGERRYRITTK